MKKKSKEGPVAGSWKSLLRTVKALRLPWVWIVVGLGLNLYLSSLMLKMPNTTASLLGGDLSGSALWQAVRFYILLGLMTVLMIAGQVQAQSYGSCRARQSVWKKMLGMRMAFFDRNDPSDMMSAVVNDTGTAVLDMVNIIIYLVPNIYYVVGAILTIRSYHWLLALACFAMLPLKCLYAIFIGRKFQAGSAQVYRHIGTLTSFLADRIHNLSLVKAYTNEAQEQCSGEKATKDLLKANMKLVHLDNIAVGAASVIDILQKFVVVVVAVILLQRGEIDISMWLAFFLFSQNLFSYMDQIFDSWVRIKGMQGTFQRVTEIMTGQSEPEGGSAPYPTEGDITFHNVTFTYPETDTPALENVSFTVPRGTSAAIVGLCGSGKTTSVSLLERFYVPEQGSVTLGQTDIRDISLQEYRRHMAYVQQGTGSFDGTVRQALTYGIDRPVTDGEILSAAEKTGFDDYLQTLPDGLAHMCSSDAMSGGQNQRLALTREFLRGGDILLLDEPTSALDVQVADKIRQTVNTLFAHTTRIIITHDLHFAQGFDKILVLDRGHLVGEGTHEALLESCAPYRQMLENASKEDGQ